MSGHMLADAQAVSSAVSDSGIVTCYGSQCMMYECHRTRVQAQLLLSCSGAAFAANTGVNRARREGVTPGMPALLLLVAQSLVGAR